VGSGNSDVGAMCDSLGLVMARGGVDQGGADQGGDAVQKPREGQHHYCI
jgi:hypothetical protein